MIIDPYKTTKLINSPNTEVVKEIVNSFIRGELISHASNKDLLLVKKSNTKIPLFSQPIIFDRSGINVVLDIRPFSSESRAGELIITAKEDMDVHVLQALLTLDAAKHHGYGNFSIIKPFSMKIFVNWILRKLSTNLALDHGAQIRLTMITAVYYLSLFRDEETTPDILSRDALMIYRTLRIPALEVTDFMAEIPTMRNIVDYVNVLKEFGGSPRFSVVEPLFLHNLFATSWFGFQSKETLAVALEHPPTFIAMIYKAMTERSFNRTDIGKILDSVGKSDTSLINGVDGIIGKRS